MALSGEVARCELLDSAETSADGIPGDRVVQVYDPEGRIVTARTAPRLLGLKATLGPMSEPLVDGRPWTAPEVAAAMEGQLLSAVSTHVREWFRKTPIERAGARVADTHPHGEELKRALPAWFTSHQFATALFKIQQVAERPSDKALRLR